ncbi:transcriptional regulator [Longispora fulva]|uniref:DeoR family transcriptional regulator of aga operon n=1 Tax=Longispora fulva TaxID=619741 RepID=A0A8J7GFD0_9ACTN|nr:DeoR/GlpR family DNA-binding transcription regulator [Longispora fulva]MBG6135517.1 DeoR family transcriptional regulator of aga operon [Longispora fulva]GIG56243.1 transcriptional regulator [Longispora fulva]
MNRHERLSALLDILATQGQVEIEEAAERLGMSAATVRRDLDQLAAQQLVTRTRGGAVANQVSYDLPMRYKSARHVPEKERIAAAAAALVKRDMVVALNGGTTTTAVARAIATSPALADPGGGQVVTVVSNALNIASELIMRPNVRVVATGGVALPQSYELIGPLATRIISELTFDIAFLGVDGIEPAFGASAHHDGEASINHLMAELARQVVVVTDSSKLMRRSFARICHTREVNLLITDRDAPADAVRAFEDLGVTVITV